MVEFMMKFFNHRIPLDDRNTITLPKQWKCNLNLSCGVLKLTSGISGDVEDYTKQY